MIEILSEQEKPLDSHLTVLCSYLLGTYKPRIRCYDTYQLSLKFERCLDSDGTSEKCFLFYILHERVCEPFWITWISALICDKMCSDLHQQQTNTVALFY